MWTNFLFLILLAPPTLGGFVMVESQTSAVDDATVSLMKICYSDRLNPLVIAGKFEDIYRVILREFDTLSVILVDENTKMTRIHHQHLRLETFVLRANTVKELYSVFQLLKKLNQWNIEATFFLARASDENCDGAADFLKVAWKMNLLSSIFVCSVDHKSVRLYTYNPYTSRAPAPWKKVKKSGRWTLYFQFFTKDVFTECDTLVFDKTQSMDGYEIRGIGNVETGASGLPKKEYGIESLKTKLRYDKGQYLLTIFSTLNVTPVIRWDLNSYNSSVMANTVKSGYDILLNSYPMDIGGKLNVSGLFPPNIAVMGVVTRHRGFLTPVEKISRFYQTNILILTGIVLAITIMLLTVYKRRGIATAIFETLRMVLNYSFLHSIADVPVRIYFIPVFFLFIILTSTFAGNLTGFLTKPELRRDAENMRDLDMHQFNIYGISAAMTILPADFPTHNIHITKMMNCTKEVLADPLGACIAPITFIVAPAIYSHLHYKELPPPIMRFINYWIRDNWPLAQKINSLTMRLLDSGLINHWADKLIGLPLAKLSSSVVSEELPQIRKITMDDLRFAFLLLAAGLSVSIVAFIIEVIMHYWKLRYFEKIIYKSCLKKY